MLIKTLFSAVRSALSQGLRPMVVAAALLSPTAGHALIDNVSVNVGNGTYGIGTEIQIRVRYTETLVRGTGLTPTMVMNLSPIARLAFLDRIEGGNTLVFRYVVTEGFSSPDLDYRYMDIPTGSITNSSGGSVSTSLPAPGTAGSISANYDLVIDGVRPAVTAITRVPLAPQADPPLVLSVTFSEAVTGVDASDFALVTTGTLGGTISSVTGSGTTYTVTVDNFSGEGTARLDLNSAGTGIRDAASNEIAGGFSGTAYPIDRAPPDPATITYPTDGAVITDNSRRVEGTAVGASFVQVIIYVPSGAVIGTPSVDASGNWSFNPAGILPEGPIRVEAIANDSSGNDAPATEINYTIDSLEPLVTNLVAPPNGAYAAGGTLDFVLNLDSPVIVDTTGGTPRIPLTVGATTAYATYLSGSGSTALVFRYVVQTGEVDADGIVVNQPEANGATIRDAAGNDAILTLGTFPPTSGVLVDGVFPFVTSVTPPVAATYVAGQTLSIMVAFNEAVVVDTGISTPTLALTIGGTTVNATYVSGSGSNVLVFSYTVQDGDLDTDGIALGALSASPGTITDAVGQTANLSLAGVGPTTGVLIDADRPTVMLTAPTTPQPGPFTVTVTFSEPVTGFDASDVTVTDATIGPVSGSGTAYSFTVTPSAAQFLTLQIVAGAAQDAAGNLSLASAPVEVEAASVARDFEAAVPQIREIITDQAARDLRARIAATGKAVKAAQDRLALGVPGVDRALSFQGSLQADGVTLSSMGSFGAETGLANGTRRILWGEFSLNRDAEGTTSARLDTTLAWERRLSDDALAAWFLGLEVGRADINRDFSGPLQTLGLSLGAYGVQRLDENLYLRGFASVTAGQNDLELSNGILSLQSDYRTRSLQAGATLAGVLPMGGWELRPELSLAVGRTWLGTLDLTGTAYGQTGAFQLDAGEVTLATLTFQPEFVVPLDGRAVADAASLLTIAPGLACESVSGVEDWSDCGLAFGLGVQHQSDDGLVRYGADLDVTRVGPRKDSSISLSLEHRF